MKICIMHDFFAHRGGGERLMINLARKLNADIYTGFVDTGKTFNMSGIKVTSFNVSGKYPRLLRNYFIAKRFEEFEFPKYDVYIMSGIWSIAAAAKNKPNIWYCHTPARYMYDLKNHFMNNSNFIERFVLRNFIKSWKIKDQFYAHQFSKVCANSENVKKRLMKFYGKGVYDKTIVVHPSVETKNFYYSKKSDYYLSSSRLDELKRIDLIIDVFKKMPNKKLVIIGDGPEKNNLEQLAQGCENIIFLGNVKEKEKVKIFANCIATISASVDEDFGMVPIETMAAGKPSLVVKEGGYLETVKDKKTGLFFEPNIDSLTNAIEKCEKIRWNYKLIQKEAKKYDIKEFSDKIMKIAVAITKS